MENIVLGSLSEKPAVPQQKASVPPPVPNAVALSPAEMNMLHFGSESHTPRT